MAMVAQHQGESSSGCSINKQMDSGKYVRYTAEQVEALERVYAECPKPSCLRRQQLIRECPILSNIEPKQIKVWFQNRRCRDKQRTESTRLQSVNRKLSAMNKLLMEENDRLQKQVSQLVSENGYMRQQLQSATVPNTDASCDSAVATPQQSLIDANNPAGLLSIAEETLAEFLSKATGTAVDWVQMPGMKPGPDSVGIFAISQSGTGAAAARACGLVSLEPAKIAEILKDRPSWFRECRSLEIFTMFSAANGGKFELLYTQVCERSISGSEAGPNAASSTSQFVRAEMLPSGYLIRPCEGGGSIIHIVDHLNLQAWSVPDVLRPLYESSKAIAQKMTIAVSLEHRSEWADFNVDAYSASSLKSSMHSYTGMMPIRFTGSQIVMPLGPTIEHEEMCSGIDENAVGACSELVFAPIGEMFPDDAPLLHSGFRIVPLDTNSGEPKDNTLMPHKTLDLTLGLDVDPTTKTGHTAENSGPTYSPRSILTIAFQFPCASNLHDTVATMTRHYVRGVISSVQKVALALSPFGFGPTVGPSMSSAGSPEASILAHWICKSYSSHVGTELLRIDSLSCDSVLKSLWHHQDAIICCSLKARPVFVFVNQAGLDMLETTLISLQDITLDKIFGDLSQKALFSEFAKIMQQGYAYLPSGFCVSTMGRQVSYEQAFVWKVVAAEEESVHCLAFSFVNWSFV
ncbi:Homeobox-leucine zipper protein REVOLUTA [Striga hermonthica]|uniref:Homeobox-leucine zipper protein REVOLUTA n=1 Tax=Striga hermonthica TaxID=68872 RepID=A0A9N7RCL5_STRHE|nr:Homeobox-leucine zipper protein REVOLUTA [Striga hermonthica]